MIDNPPESIRLFALCANMKWAHLPLSGGLYAQHPRLLEEFEVIFQQLHAEEARRDARQKQEMARASKGGTRRR